jgi:4-oxalocrotonate tautomerase
MPFTSVKVIEGVFSKEQKARLIEKITEAMIEVEGESMRHLTWVVIEEVKSGDWAIGGKPIFPRSEAGRRSAFTDKHGEKPLSLGE